MRRSLQRSQNLAVRLGEGVSRYNSLMTVHRSWMQDQVNGLYKEFEAHPDPERLLHLFLIYFSSIGSHMVAKADVWLKTWGESLSAHGFSELGQDYAQHASEEVRHDQWHRNDVKALARLYAEKYHSRLDTDEILAEGKSACVNRYYELSEKQLTGAHACLSLAELYETEILALDQAPAFIGYCIVELGYGILPGLSFLRGHVVSDVDHIRENIEQMHAYLSRKPDDVSSLEHIGRVTIEIYKDYFYEALELAKSRWERLSRQPRAVA